MFNKLKWLLILCFAVNILFAQASGRISGRITDTKDNPLAGASVMLTHEIVNGDSVKLDNIIGTASDIDGYYTLRQVPPGEYILKTNYIGYGSNTVVVNINSGEETQKNLELISISLETTEIEVTAQAKGQMDAINKQLSSAITKNIVSSERLLRNPDANAAAAVGRLPGVSTVRSGGEASDFVIRGLSPKYNTVMIEGVEMPSNKGNSRNATVSGVSQFTLEGIELFKTITADMDANTVSGALNMQLREATEGFNANILVMPGYNALNDYWGNYQINGNIENRFFDNKLGAKLSLTAEKINRSTQTLGAGYAIETSGEGQQPLYLTSIGINDVNNINRKYNGTLILDYRFSPSSQIKFSNFYTRRPVDHTSVSKNFSVANRSISTSISQNKEGYNETYMSTISGKHPLNIFDVDYRLSYSGHDRYSPTDRSWGFTMNQAFPKEFADQETRSKHPLEVLSSIVPDTTSNILEESIGPGMSFGEDDLSEKKYTAELNIEMPFQWINFSGFLKTGISFKHKSRKRNVASGGQNWNKAAIRQAFSQLDWTHLKGGYGGHISMLGLYDRDIKGFLQGDVDFGFYPNLDRLNQLYEHWEDYCYSWLEKDTSAWMKHFGTSENMLFRWDEHASMNRDQDASQNYWATYLMSQINIGESITFIPGVRYEYVKADLIGEYHRETMDSQSIIEPLEPDSINDVIRTNSYVLPMIHLKYEPTDWLHVKSSYTQTLHRPSFTAINPYQYVNTLTQNIYDFGAPELKPELWTNYELSFAFSGNKLGLFGISGFYKTVEDKIWDRSWKRVPGDPKVLSWEEGAVISMDTWLNQKFNVYVSGGEVEMQTSFWYLPEPFNHLTFNANYTYMHNRVQYPYSETKQVPYDTTARGRVMTKLVRTDTTFRGNMLDQPRQIANVSVGYDYKGFSSWLSYRYMGRKLESKEVKSELDRYSSAYQSLDLQIRQALPIEGAELLLNISNLTDVREKQYYRGDDRPSGLENYGQTYAFGIRYRF